MALRYDRYHYFANCTQLNGADVTALQEMIKDAIDISHETFMAHVEASEVQQLFPQYDWGNERGGLRLSRDWHVRYHRGKWKGQWCYYIVHSATEYLFLQPQEE